MRLIARPRPIRVLALFVAGVIGLGFTAKVGARALEDIQRRGVLSLCAAPNALPFASRNGERPGYQIELGRALAERLGVRLQVEWVLLSFHYRTVDCDIAMDTIADQESQGETELRWSAPYYRSGVALAVRPGSDGITGFDSLGQQRRVGVLQGSLAHMYLEQRGARTVPFGFEDDMLEALVGGELDAAAVTPLSIGYYNLEHPAARLRLVYAYDAVPELSWDLAVGMRRSDRFLRKAIDQAVQAMLDDGTFERIYASYGIEHRPPKQRGIVRIEREEPLEEGECVRLGRSRECMQSRSSR
jgi:polar amino acid transport system substrate-binding protein